MANVNVYIPDELYARWREAKNEGGTGLSTLTQQALLSYLSPSTPRAGELDPQEYVRATDGILERVQALQDQVDWINGRLDSHRHGSDGLPAEEA